MIPHRFCYYYDGIDLQGYSDKFWLLFDLKLNLLESVKLKEMQDLSEVFKNHYVADVSYNFISAKKSSFYKHLNYFKKTK